MEDDGQGRLRAHVEDADESGFLPAFDFSSLSMRFVHAGLGLAAAAVVVLNWCSGRRTVLSVLAALSSPEYACWGCRHRSSSSRPCRTRCGPSARRRDRFAHHLPVKYSSHGANAGEDRPQEEGDKGKEEKHVVVVGGGVGGLAVACRLMARQQQQRNKQQKNNKSSFKVTILEKNQEVGGRCGSFVVDLNEHGPFRHERGPSLLLLPDTYRNLFESCGSTMDECGLQLRPCTPAYQVVFDDGDRVHLGFRRWRDEHDKSITEGEAESRRALDEMEPNGAHKWDEYLRVCEAYLECGLPNFIEQRLDATSLPRFVLESLKDKARAWPLQPHSSMLDQFFQSTKLKALASFQDLYVGLEPYHNPKEAAGGIFTSTAPAVFGLLAAIEMHPTNDMCGVYAPVGGFDAVTTAMTALARNLGVHIRCGRTVTKVTNDGVYVVETASPSNPTGANDPEFVPADLVVVNADVPYAQQCLLKSDAPTDRVVYDWSTGVPGRPRYRFSSGVIAFHWSTSRTLTDLNTHNVFLVASNHSAAEHSWRALRDDCSSNGNRNTSNYRAKVVEPFNFYVHRASQTDPTAAPKGHDAILVLVPCETLRRDPNGSKLSKADAIAAHAAQFDEDRIASIREAVLQRLAAIASLQGLQDWILHEVVDTPATYADLYHVAAGSPFALSHGLGQLSITRPGAQVNSMPNVLHVGASARPGNGVPLVLIGAKLTADLAGRMLKEDLL